MANRGDRASIAQLTAAGARIAPINSHACRFAIYAAARSLGYSTTQIGRRFGVHHTNVIYGSRRADAEIVARILRSVTP